MSSDQTPGSIGGSKATSTTVSGMTSTSGSYSSGRTGRWRNSGGYGSVDTNYQGLDKDIGVVLGTRSEKHLKHGVTYEGFIETMEKVISSQDGGILVRGLFNDKDPLDRYKEGKFPKKLIESSTGDYAGIAQEDLDEIWRGQLKAWIADKKKTEAQLAKAYGMIFGQCTDALQSAIKAQQDYEKDTYDAVWLVKTIKKIVSGVDDQRNKMRTYVLKLLDLLNLKQQPNEPLDSYRRRVKNGLDVLEMAGGGSVLAPDLEKHGQARTPEELAEKSEEFAAMFLLYQSDMRLFGDRVRGYEEQDEDGVGKGFPKTVGKVVEILTHHLARKDGVSGRNGRQFFQPGEQVGKQDGGVRKDAEGYRGGNMNSCIPCDVEIKDIVRGTNKEIWTIKCAKCEKWGHSRAHCPVRNHTYLSRCMLSQRLQHYSFDPNHFYLDTGANFSSTFNPSILSRVDDCARNDIIEATTNSGTMYFSKKGQLKLLPIEMYYNRDSVATIIAYDDLINIQDSTMVYHGWMQDAFLLVFNDGHIMEFKKADIGLYYYDLCNFRDHEHSITDKEFAYLQTIVPAFKTSFMQTVSANEKLLSQEEKKRALTARSWQEYFGWPSTTEYKAILDTNQVHNCPITSDDVEKAISVYGPPVPTLKGKTTRPHPQTHESLSQMALPKQLLDTRIDLYTDILFVNNLPFLLTISGRINYTSLISLHSRSAKLISKGLRGELVRYVRRGLKVIHVHGDGEFDKQSIHQAVRPAVMKIRAPHEHVGVAERMVRTIKEKARCIVHSLPYTHYPRELVRGLLHKVVYTLNLFPSKNGISSDLSPDQLVNGNPKFDCSRKHVSFGTYVQAYTGTDNTMEARTVEAIALFPANNRNGYHFMNLHTGKRFMSNKWETLPTPRHVISAVHELASKEKRPLIQNKDFIFEWNPGTPIEDQLEEEERREDDDVVEEVEDQHEPVEDDDIVEEGIPISESSSEGTEESEDIDDMYNQHYESEEQESNDLLSQIENADELMEEEDNNQDDSFDSSDDELDLERTRTRSTQSSHEPRVTFSDEPVEVQPTRRSARIRERNQREEGSMGITSKYGAAAQFLMQRTFVKDMNETIAKEHEDTINHSYLQRAVNVIFAQQMSAKKGIKQFGERAIAALVKEFTQLDEGAVPEHNKPVVVPICPHGLSHEEKRKALDAVTIIQEKRTGDLKGRACANGSKQKYYLKQGDTMASPTVSLEGLITTMVIAAYEGRKVMSFDVPGAYLQADLPDDELLLLKLNGDMVDIMCKVNPEHKKNIIKENGKDVLYMRVLRAIYGCIEAALQWYKLFTKVLKEEGYVLNPYDKCVANKVVNGKQCTVAWHVDDCIASHVEEKVLDDLGQTMIKYFGDMKLEKGDTHDFLGMKITITEDKKVKIDMRDQINILIKEFETENELTLNDKVTSPATHNLFEVNEEEEELDEFKSKQFHTTTAKLLYLMKRARPDTETGVSFLMRRVSKSKGGDWKKLLRMLGWLKRTKDDVRVIGASSLNEVFTWIDAAYAVHDNMRSHMGGAISMGYGVLTAKSAMEKLNVKSSTEAELVGVSEYLPYNIWLLMFLKHQGYEIRDNVVYQDNMSAMLMEKNGRNSCTGNSRHINIRYFFVKDRIDKKELRVTYCPTHLMLADYFSKPLVGKLFNEQREYIMGWRPMSELMEKIQDHKMKEGVEI